MTGQKRIRLKCPVLRRLPMKLFKIFLCQNNKFRKNPNSGSISLRSKVARKYTLMVIWNLKKAKENRK